MHLYALTLQKSSNITQAVHGNFAGTKQQLIAVARNKVLELLRCDAATGKTSTVMVTEVFGIIRTLSAFRLTGSSKDYLVVGSDSGRIVILEYNPEKNVMEKVHMETYGKSGCRRIVPGQYLGVDPKGRAVMIGAIEKQKLVYILNRDAAARLTISSPLEAHKSHTFVFHLVGLDVGFENPIFACLEIDYEDIDQDPTGEAFESAQQTLTFYELDLGLNHVVRKQSDALEQFANFLITVPGGSDGPGGVLVCSENAVTWRTFGDHTPVTVQIPRRDDPLQDPGRSTIINCSTMHKTKSMFFFLLQTELGDVFKLTMFVNDDEVQGLVLKYFDTVPTASSICLLKSGLLFVAAEFGNHQLYQIAQLGDNEDEPVYNSAETLSELPLFKPRELRNLVLLDELESLSPLTQCQIQDIGNEENVQLYAACGRGPRSSFRTLRHGLEVTEMAVSDLPGNPSGVWTVKKNINDSFDAYIVVSFTNATLVLSIGETVEEITDSGFSANVPTLFASRIGDDSVIQIHPEGIRHIRADGRVNEWKTPHKRTITHSAVNDRQVAIALQGGELVYFILDRSGQLNEYTERMDLHSEVGCITIAPTPEGALVSLFLAVGLADNTVRIISLDEKDCLQPLSMQALPDRADSLAMVDMNTGIRDQSSLFLNIGLENGVLLRTTVDNIAGTLSDTRTRYLGSRSVKLFRVKIQQTDAILALSSRPWLSYNHQGHPRLTPLSYDMLEHASSFCSEQCPEGIVSISRHTLRILSLDKLGTVFNQTVMPLPLTPRKFIIDESTKSFILIEGDHNVHSEESKEEVLESQGVMNTSDLSVEAQLGSAKAGLRRWSSNIRIFNPQQGQTTQLIPLERNEMAISVAKVSFAAAKDGSSFIVVGTAKDWQLNPKSFSAAYLLTYRIVPGPDSIRLEFVHRTEVEDIPGAVHAYHGRLLAGVGRLLRIYDLGKRKLLRKCENKHLPNNIVKLSSIGSRIFIGDLRESVFLAKYKPSSNDIVIFADDTLPRWTTTLEILDFNTIAIADKFGNISVVRLPDSCNDDVDEDPTGVRAFWDRGVLNGAPNKMDVLCEYYVGEAIMSLQKATLTPGGSECIVYTTLLGGIGVVFPFTAREDIDFFQHLEMHLRAENPPICGRDHLAFRSYYSPSKNCIDGDMCEQYNSIDSDKKKAIAEELDRSPAEVSKKLEDMRTRYAF